MSDNPFEEWRGLAQEERDQVESDLSNFGSEHYVAMRCLDAIAKESPARLPSAAIDPVCKRCGTYESKHARVSRECPLPYGGFEAGFGKKAVNTFDDGLTWEPGDHAKGRTGRWVPSDG